MKKLYLLAIAACGFAAAQAQDDKIYLQEVQSTLVPQEIEKYYYNDNYLVDSVYFMNTEIEGATTFIYDESGNTVQRNMYQLIDFVYKQTGYRTYEYNEEGQPTLCHNYMDYGWGMNIQGSEVYTYENGLLTNLSVYFSTGYEDGGNPYEWTDYEYDDNGVLQQTFVHGTDSESGITGIQQNLIYTYDDQGRVSQVTTKIDNALGELIDNQRDEYVYNEDGDLYSHTIKQANTGWQPAQMTYYKYDTDVLASDVVYPNDVYGSYSVQPNGIHMLVRDSTISELDGQWGLYDVQEYRYANYDDVKKPSGIAEQTASDEATEMAAYVLGGRLFVDGLADGAVVMVYDVNGRLLLSGNYTSAGIPTYILPMGVKIVKSGNFSAKFF